MEILRFNSSSVNQSALSAKHKYCCFDKEIIFLASSRCLEIFPSSEKKNLCFTHLLYKILSKRRFHLQCCQLVSIYLDHKVQPCCFDIRVVLLLFKAKSLHSHVPNRSIPSRYCPLKIPLTQSQAQCSCRFLFMSFQDEINRVNINVTRNATNRYPIQYEIIIIIYS